MTRVQNKLPQIMFIFYINFAGKLRKLIMTPLTPIGHVLTAALPCYWEAEAFGNVGRGASRFVKDHTEVPISSQKLPNVSALTVPP